MIAPEVRTTERLARGLLIAHLALIAFSSLAMVTVLNGPPGPMLQQEPNATIMRLGWKFSGPTYVVLGALAALVHAGGRLGWWRATALLVVGSVISLGAELAGTATGLPFGDYRYTPLLGYRIAGLVPFPIPISWFYMLYASLAICGRRLAPADDARSRWRWAAVAGLVLVAWDVSMDPAMVRTSHWLWGSGEMFTGTGLPAWVVAFFTRDAFYGMPLSNWFGWYVTGTLVARAMLAIAPPTAFTGAISPSRLPLVLYAANGVMPVVLCVRDDLWGAAILGTLAMTLPLALTWRRVARHEGAAAMVTSTA
ncbi:MAG: carotenoid biosynthesis protein [Gemmatimonadaceae bacterium]|nr:carotenoid biosynthesis protein [Gemmatimonadaceae bacterium]